jgi:excisionase family DNA binding protein
MNATNVIRKLHDIGMSNIQIAKLLEVSRQRVWVVVNSKPAPKFKGEIEKLNGLITVREVSIFLGLHPNTIRKWANEGRIKSFRIGPRRDRRFRLEDINQLVKIE